MHDNRSTTRRLRKKLAVRDIVRSTVGQMNRERPKRSRLMHIAKLLDGHGLGHSSSSDSFHIHIICKEPWNCQARIVCGKIFWQARGTGFQPVKFDTGKMPVPRWHWQDFLASAWHGLPAREIRYGQDARATVASVCQRILPHTQDLSSFLPVLTGFVREERRA